MNRSLKMRIASGILSAWSSQVCASGRPAENTHVPRLCIHLYNLANASAGTLDRATKEAARILASAGVETIWQQGPADAPEANISDQSAASPGSRDTRNYLVVKILQRFPDHSIPGALGYSLPDARFGPHVHIFYNRVERVSEWGDVDLATMLGHAMAHEVGHVLLGSTEHSHDGIMKGCWGRADFQKAAKGYMAFTPVQGKAIHKRAALRLKAQIGE